MLQTPEVAAARIQAWMHKHPSVAETDANIAILTKYIADHFSVAGECVIDGMFLDLAYQNIGGALQHIAGPEVQAQIAHGTQQTQALLAEKQAREAEAERERKRIEHEQLLEQRQRNRQPGVSSAYEGMDEENDRRQREATERKNAAVRAQRHAAFLKSLKDIDVYLVTDSQGRVRWGATGDYRKAGKENLKKLYPEFASEIR